MTTDPYSTLSGPASSDQFIAAMAQIALGAGAERFLVIRLHGMDLAQVVRVIHGAGAESDGKFDDPLHWTVNRFLDEMRRTRLPLLFGSGEHPGIGVPGYEFGVGALARVRDGGCVVYLGRSVQITDPEQMMLMMSSAQLSAQHAAAGIAGHAPKPCPMTRRELDCLEMFAAGRTAKQAARDMGVSARTVESHLDRARIRCGVDSTLSLMSMAIREGWIDWPGAKVLVLAAD